MDSRLRVNDSEIHEQESKPGAAEVVLGIYLLRILEHLATGLSGKFLSRLKISAFGLQQKLRDQ